MTTSINSKERFRRSFVLVMTIAYAVAFLAMLGGFFEALLMAAVLSGITYPLYRWCVQKFGGRDTLASLVTLLTTLLVILVPLILLIMYEASPSAYPGGMLVVEKKLTTKEETS